MKRKSFYLSGSEKWMFLLGTIFLCILICSTSVSAATRTGNQYQYRGSAVRRNKVKVTAIVKKKASKKNTKTTQKPEQKTKSKVYDFKRITGDLVAEKTTTKPDGDTSVQSFAKDDKYYYYIQKTDKQEGNLRITRVCYDENGAYKKDHMDLKYFGHATNLDCSVYNGKTYLWTGADAKRGGDRSLSITCFEYKKGKTLYHHGEYTYRIPMGGSGRLAQNVYPAISPDGKSLCVRYTYGGKQHFQTYELSRGRYIDPKKIKKRMVLSATIGDFQGFDFDDTALYTIEGSPTRDYVRGSFAPTVVRKFSWFDSSETRKVVTGASELKFREPEGIKVTEEGKLEILFASRLASGQYCNTYTIR